LHNNITSLLEIVYCTVQTCVLNSLTCRATAQTL